MGVLLKYQQEFPIEMEAPDREKSRVFLLYTCNCDHSHTHPIRQRNFLALEKRPFSSESVKYFPNCTLKVLSPRNFSCVRVIGVDFCCVDYGA